LLTASVLAPSPAVSAAPFSRSLSVDFFRDVPSRNLKGLATRSDGRLVAGPVLTDLQGPAVADILWCLESGDDAHWLVGTGPEGKIFELTLDLEKSAFTSRELVDLDDTHVFALKRLPDGTLLAGTSPYGTLALICDGKLLARLTLPADSIYDLQLSPDGKTAYAGTGNPGQIYAVDLAKFSAAGLSADKLTDPAKLAEKGLRLLGEIKDRNVRRLALLGDTLVAGSAPKGNIYTLPLTGGTPMILQENRDAEVAALLPQPNGDLYAALVFSNQQAENRLNRPPANRNPSPPENTAEKNNPSDPDQPPGSETISVPLPAVPVSPDAQSPAIPLFPGRSAVVYFPKNRLPETIVARKNLAFYALAQRSDTLLIAGGEQGDVLGYDLAARLSLTFAGTDSAQVNQIVPLPAPKSASTSAPARYLLLRNNAPGLALLDFDAAGPREAETKRLDLGSPATLGALRFPRIREIDASQVAVDVRTTFASDEAEGWAPWISAPLHEDGWLAADARGRHVKLRLRLPSAANAAQLDRADLYFLPQNRRPQLTDFRIAAPGFALVPPSDVSDFQSPPTTLGQLLGGPDHSPAANGRRGINSATIYPQPGMQIVTWTLGDADDDELRSTFSIRQAGTENWLDLAVNTPDSYAQFDTAHLADGVYFTRLVATEQAPRAFADRLSATFETDDLVIDKTPPVLGETKISRSAGSLSISVAGRDSVSLLLGVEFIFNNGYRAEATQPDDGIRDSRAETFTLRVDPDKILGATSVEILLYDELNNAASRRLDL
jgi:hypothetical protein